MSNPIQIHVGSALVRCHGWDRRQLDRRHKCRGRRPLTLQFWVLSIWSFVLDTCQMFPTSPIRYHRFPTVSLSTCHAPTFRFHRPRESTTVQILRRQRRISSVRCTFRSGSRLDLWSLHYRFRNNIGCGYMQGFLKPAHIWKKEKTCAWPYMRWWVLQCDSFTTFTGTTCRWISGSLSDFRPDLMTMRSMTGFPKTGRPGKLIEQNGDTINGPMYSLLCYKRIQRPPKRPKSIIIGHERLQPS